MKKTPLMLSAIALVLSLFSLISVWVNPSADSSSNLIATLGIICTVLIGWQIFSLIDIRAYEKKLGDLESRLIETEERLKLQHKAAQQPYVADSILSDRIARIYSYLRNVAPSMAPVFLYEEIMTHLSSMGMMLGGDSDVYLRITFCRIQNCCAQKIGLYPDQKKDLEKAASDLLNTVAQSKWASRSKTEGIFDDIVLLIHELPVRRSKKSASD